MCLALFVKGVRLVKVERLINNNMVLSKDSEGREVIVVGRGIGYAGRRGDPIADERIEKTFVVRDGADAEQLIRLFRNTPVEDVLLASKLDRYVRDHYSRRTSEMLLVILLDHVSAALRRYQSGIELDNPMLYDIRRIYPEEFKIAKQLVEIINHERNVSLKQDEAGFITLNIVNAQLERDAGTVIEVTQLVQRMLDVVLSHYPSLEDCADQVWWSRFLTHLKYLAIRVLSGVHQTNELLSRSLMLQEIRLDVDRPEVYSIVDEVSSMVEGRYDYSLDGDEKLYLMLHLTVLLRESGSIPAEEDGTNK